MNITFLISTLILAVSCQNKTYQAPNVTERSSETNPDSTTPQSPVASSYLSVDQLCGIANQSSGLSIVGGQEATVQDLVSRTTVKVFTGSQGAYCSGTVIGPNHVVTAAHCFDDVHSSSTPVGIGWGLNPSQATMTKAKSWTVHPRYKKDMFSSNGALLSEILYDVALIHFSGSIPAGYGVAPVGSTTGLPAGTVVTIAGYGQIREVDYSSLPVLRHVSQSVTFNPNLKEVNLKIGDGKGACDGDSGGPGYIVDPQRSSCLRTLSTTTGPSREGTKECNQGSGTLMDITLYQGWMSCSYQKMGASLPYLKTSDGSEVDCTQTIVTTATY